jgi:hypothetical protein
VALVATAGARRRGPPTKLIYLAIIRADAKWQRSRTWSAPRAAPKIHFGDRYPG